jgi:hypothetical protein
MKKLTVAVFALCLSVFVQAGAASQQAAPVQSGGSPVQADAINQKDACHTSDPSINRTCIPGHKILYENPIQQAPDSRRTASCLSSVVFASNNCDLRYQVVMSNEGVACIFLPITDYNIK